MSRRSLLFPYILTIWLLSANTVSCAEITTIRFASEIYPPFTVVHANKELQGFDINVAKALCEKIKAKCTFSNDKFSDMIPSLKAHRYDAWINAISISEERQKEVDFTKPYFSTRAMFLATNATVFNAAPIEIKGKTIGIGIHTCYDQYLKNTYGDTIKFKHFNTRDEAFTALENATVDTIIDDDIALKHWRLLQKDPKKYRLINLPAKYPQLVWHEYGIAVTEGNFELIKILNQAIDSVKSDGTLDKLIEKYFTR